MSYILDALKKLEQEKSRKTKPYGSITTTGDLFSGHTSVRHKHTNRMGIVLAAVGIAITCGISWYFFKGKDDSARNNRSIAAPIAPPLPAVAANVTPVSSAPAVVAPVPAAPSPVQPQIPVQSPLVNPPQQQPVSQESSDDDDRPRRAAKKKPAIIPQQVPKTVHSPAAAKPALQMTAAPADIQVSGVAWQDDRGLRRAVVNGLLLKEGATIAGAQMKEILPDRVRFERAGAQFEVPFVSSPTTGK